MSKVVDLVRRSPDPELVEYLEKLLSDAKSGQLIGVCVLTNYPTEATVKSLGEWSPQDALYSFEVWKMGMLERQRE